MSNGQTIHWAGKSGTDYVYTIYVIGTSFRKIPGNYIFAKQDASGWWAVYVGETGDLSERFDNHHKANCINRNGATHIHVHESSSDDKVRRAEEDDVLRRWGPTACND